MTPCAEGTNVVPVTFEVLAYGFLDIASKVRLGSHRIGLFTLYRLSSVVSC